jgi:medium-chain acyl-[acyl-carrier-protein] hydrolase
MPSLHKSKLWWIKPVPNGRAIIRLFCFPYAGGSAAIFQSWHSHLNARIEIVGVQLPGRASRISEPLPVSLVDLVPTLGNALTPIMDKPFAFFGHSMGAILGFELARWLRSECKVGPEHIVISAHRAPQIQIQRPLLHTLGETDFLAKIIDLEGIPSDLQKNHEILALLLPTLRADCRMDETYTYVQGEPLSCPITVFTGKNDQSVEGGPEEWRMHTTGQFTQHLIDGNHFFIHSHKERLLGLVDKALGGSY